MTGDDLLVRASEPGWGNAPYSFGPADKTTATLKLYLGSLKSYDSQLYNPYLDIPRDPLEKKTVAWKKTCCTQVEIEGRRLEFQWAADF